MSLQKILVINTKYRIFGGEDANIIDELKFLRNYFEVEYLEYNNSDKLSLSDLFGLIFQNNFYSNSVLKNQIRNFNPDVVFLHNTWFKAGLGIFKILKKENIKTIHKIHNYRFDCSRFFLSKNHLKNNLQCPACGIKRINLGFYNKYFSESIIKSLFINLYSKKYFKILKTFPLEIIVLSKFQKNYLENLGVEQNKISIYTNPIEVSLQTFSKYNSNSNKVIFAGRLEETKGIEEILKIWNKMDTKNLILEIIGSIDENDILFKKYKSKNVKFLGYLDNDLVKSKIKSARAVVSATKLFEGQPRILLEASSFGVPSIYPNFGGMNDFFPKNYSLSFKQFNYKDLEKKMVMLHDTRLLSHESKIITKYMISNFTEQTMFQRFNNILNRDEIKQ